ncbi:MAG: putative DOCK family protein, partial [Streblomastix strix]
YIYYPTIIQPVRQVQSFNPPPLPMPQNSFTHFLYIYPEMIDFTIKVNGQRVRNISVKICVRDTDTQPKYISSLSEVLNFNAKEGIYNAWNCEGTLPLICGGSHSKRRIGTYTTAVMYHDNQPRLYDEVKIALPFSLSPKLHVLFTFFHVSCQAAKDQGTKKANPDRKPRNIVGYAILPIGSEDWIRNDRRKALPIAASLETGYMTTILRQEREKEESVLNGTQRSGFLNWAGFGPQK